MGDDSLLLVRGRVLRVIGAHRGWAPHWLNHRLASGFSRGATEGKLTATMSKVQILLAAANILFKPAVPLIGRKK